MAFNYHKTVNNLCSTKKRIVRIGSCQFGDYGMVNWDGLDMCYFVLCNNHTKHCLHRRCTYCSTITDHQNVAYSKYTIIFIFKQEVT